ncbi:MAG: aminotransferase class IV family protein [Verrucomicrobia bacterium]|nr:aminotransferase class IV family protein [Verrucomicrobiota bacterium]
MSMILFRNGQFVPEQEAGVSPLDRGFLYGDGVFETLRCYEGKFFRLARHVERTRAGLARLSIAPPAWLDDAADILRELVTRNAVAGGVARIVVTRGVGEFGLLGKQATEPLMLVACWNQPPPAAARYERGINCMIAQQRLMATAGIKSLNYLPQVLARREADAAGADDGLMLNSHGHVAEATAANIFLVLRRELVTPSLEGEVLPGITRAAVLELAHAEKVPVVERVVHATELVHAEEIFLTSSVGEITPVTRLSGHWVKVGQPGPITRDLMRAYAALVKRDAK